MQHSVKKKNLDLTAPLEAKYALPDLDAPKQQVAVTPQPAITPKVEQPTVAPAPTPQPISEQVPTVNPEPIAPQPTPQPAAAPQSVATTPVQPAAEPKVGSSPIMGGSLSDLLKKVSNPTESEGKPLQITIDEESEAKMLKEKDAIVKRMCSDRPRFVSAFEGIEFEGNIVKLAVPSPALQEELLNDRFWILKKISEMAGIKGSLEMKIEIKEMDFKLKPIKLEDRVAHIRKVMSEFDYMQKALDIDVE